MTLLKGVRNWWRVGQYGGGVLAWVGVPESKRQEILEECGSDEEKAVHKCLQWWVDHATDVSWRKIIHTLDWAEETGVADTLRHLAEPPSG